MAGSKQVRAVPGIFCLANMVRASLGLACGYCTFRVVVVAVTAAVIIKLK